MPLLLTLFSPLGAACDERDQTASKRAPRRAVPVASRRRERPPPPLPSNVVEARKRRLELPAPESPEQRLAFSGRRLLQLGPGVLRVFTLPQLGLLLERPVARPRRALRLARSGGLLALTAGAVLHLPPASKQLVTHPRVPFLPGSQLLPARESAAGFWVFHPVAEVAHRYALGQPGAGFAAIEQELALAGFDGRGLTLLEDGAFVYTAGRALVRHHPTSRPRSEVLLPENANRHGGLLRLVPDRRVDRVWVAFRDGELWLVQVAPGFQVVRRSRLPSPPFALARAGRRLAVLTQQHLPDEPRRWALLIHDLELAPQARYPVPGPPGFRQRRGWVRRVLENRDLAVSGSGRFVAVGGADQLLVWDLERKRRLEAPASRPPGPAAASTVVSPGAAMRAPPPSETAPPAAAPAGENAAVERR